MRGKGWVLLGLMGATLWAQNLPKYSLILKQSYVRASGSGPDSVDVWVFVRLSDAGSPRDILISSNFPFFHNIALDFSQARVIHMRKFSHITKPDYYEPISYPFTPARVNVTVRRKISFGGNGDALVHQAGQRDTIIGLRVPVRACGPTQKSILVWDTASAAILNDRLQSIKPRITVWMNDTLTLCPNLGIFGNWRAPSSLCVGDTGGFSFDIGSFPGQDAAIPDSYVVFTRRVSDGVVSSYSGIVSNLAFRLSFSRPDIYEVWVRYIETKCGCYDEGLKHQVRVHPRPAVGQIIGPDTVYVPLGGASYGYSLSALSGGLSYGNVSWYYGPGAGGSPSSPPAGASTTVSFSAPPGTGRVDTLVATYTVTGTPCSQVSMPHLIVVLPCRSVPPARAFSRVVCEGQRAAIEVPLPFEVDSLRWQIRDGSGWQNIPDGVGTGATATLYITPPVRAPGMILRARVYSGPCVVDSRPDTITVSGDFLDRNLYAVESPICAGDTANLRAGGRGKWITRNGRGTFINENDPEALYVSDPNDPDLVQVCWVIRQEDTDKCRETAKDTLCIDITVRPSQASGSFSLNPSPREVCPGEPVQVVGTITQGLRAEWRTSGSGTFSPNASSPNATYLPGPADAGDTVYVTFVVYGTCGRAEYTDSIIVRPGVTPNILAPNRICQNIALTLSAQNSAAFDALSWWQGTVSQVQAGTALLLSRDPLYQSPALSPGTYTFTLQGIRGTCVGYDELTVEVLPAPSISFEATPRVTTLNNPTISFTNTSQGATTFLWNFGDPYQPSTDSSSTRVTFTYIRPGTYSVVLFGQNDLGCADVFVCTDCVVILPRKVFLPNAFSPNGDGKNDVFRVLPLEEGTPFTRLEVYDRWGQLVFAGDNLPYWDGRGQDGKPLDVGAYTYKALILVPDEGLLAHTGVVHIIR